VPPNDDAVRAVFIDGDILPAGGAATVHVNMATVSLACARELTEFHQACRVPYVAATVWGRPDVAAAAKLSIVAAGDDAAIARVQPLFDKLGQKTWRVGS